jgi:hypothetical protein
MTAVAEIITRQEIAMRWGRLVGAPMKMLFLGVFVGLSVGAVATSFVVLRPSQAAPHFKCAIMVTTVEEAARLDATAHTLDLTGSAKLNLMDELDSLETMGPVRFKLIGDPMDKCTVSYKQ